MFGTLLSLLRHDGLIPLDDDLDIIIFDTDKFKKTCRLQLEAKGYIVYDDMRTLDGVEKRLWIPDSFRRRAGYPWTNLEVFVVRSLGASYHQQ